ncbi:hypothetical protein [Rhizobium sp. S163]|nr:hypothetical protein [Rhizobium sp. S163]MDM9646750.1 hypothetical protein [Rhizobium sp. S163]
MRCEATKETEDGLVDARLRGFQRKKHIGAPGRGKSGSD